MNFKVWFLTAVALFAIGIAWGLSTPPGNGGALSAETSALGELARFLAQLPAWLMFVFIVLKNISAVLFAFVFSPLFLIVPVGSLVINGWLIGSVARTVVAEQSLGYLLRGILPHGIIELPALFIGEAAALAFGVAAMQAVFNKTRREDFTPRLRSNLKYLAVSTVLFVPAALIEAFITPRFLGS